MSAIKESDYGMDQTCICTDKTLTANVEACVKLSCTTKQSLSELMSLSVSFVCACG